VREISPLSLVLGNQHKTSQVNLETPLSVVLFLQLVSIMHLQGFDKFKRENPMSDKINALSFNHLEFFCGDATSVSKRFVGGMGVELAAKSDLSTGNDLFASYMMQTGTCRLVFTAPYHAVDNPRKEESPFPGYVAKKAASFVTKHGLAAYAIGIDVEDVQKTFETMIENGGKAVMAPIIVKDTNPEKGYCSMAEVSLYGDVVIRLIDRREYKGVFLPNYEDVVAPGTKLGKYGIEKLDHIVGNVHSLQDTLTYLRNMTVSRSPSCVLCPLRFHALCDLCNASYL
jgi:4-hydroxyphenylpyruvate dioxygenase